MDIWLYNPSTTNTITVGGSAITISVWVKATSITSSAKTYSLEIHAMFPRKSGILTSTNLGAKVDNCNN